MPTLIVLIGIAILIGFVGVWIAMLLWNAICPDMFGLPLITYWKMFGLMILTNFLIAGSWFRASKSN